MDNLTISAFLLNILTIWLLLANLHFVKVFCRYYDVDPTKSVKEKKSTGIVNDLIKRPAVVLINTVQTLSRCQYHRQEA